MPCTFLDAGNVSRAITTMKFRDAGTLRNIVRMKVMDDDDVTLRTVAIFAPPLSLSASDAGAEGYVDVQSASSTALPTGGLGPYSYSWAYLSGTGLSVSGASTATATFVSPTLEPGESVSAVYRCTCTDSSGQTATADADIFFWFRAPPF